MTHQRSHPEILECGDRQGPNNDIPYAQSRITLNGLCSELGPRTRLKKDKGNTAKNTKVTILRWPTKETLKRSDTTKTVVACQAYNPYKGGRYHQKPSQGHHYEQVMTDVTHTYDQDDGATERRRRLKWRRQKQWHRWWRRTGSEWKLKEEATSQDPKDEEDHGAGGQYQPGVLLRRS